MTTPRSNIEESTVLQELLRTASGTTAVSRSDSFWALVKEYGTPLTEGIEGDDAHRRVTFLWRGPAIPADSQSEQTVYLVLEPRRYCDLTETPISESERLVNLPGTDIYSLTLTLPADMLANYSFYVQPDGVNMREMIELTEYGLSRNTDRQVKKYIAKGIRDEVEKNGNHPDENNPQRFCHPDPDQRERYSILAMPHAPKRDHVPVTAEEANTTLAELQQGKRFIERKIDFSREESVNPQHLYQAESVAYMFCDNLDEMIKEFDKWGARNKGTHNILLIKNRANGEWAIGRSEPELLSDDDYYAGPIAECNRWTRMQGPPILVASLSHINTPEEFEQHRSAIERDVATLLNERQYYVYLPKDYDPHRQPPYPLILQLDGGQYVDLAMPAILDKLMEAGTIPPAVVVFCPAAGHRTVEYNCNDTFTELLADEFISHLRSQFNVASDAGHTVITGASCSGEAAVYAALRHPEVFGNVVSQSGALQFSREKIAEAFTHFAQQHHDTHFVMDAGSYETGLFDESVSLVAANLGMQAKMREYGHAVNYHYSEFTGGHSYLCWQASWPHSLAEVFSNMFRVREEARTDLATSTTAISQSLGAVPVAAQEERKPQPVEPRVSQSMSEVVIPHEADMPRQQLVSPREGERLRGPKR
ncbi:MAG: hypothetical protein A3E83_07355 [Gammaproteobacteria bacterium RIFCSPHIGHO2_12_FULL_41_20]|nr:MAG: hypothetical protein A3E83_07355 [Gammaproteobacteria bacterium RIFCSPHIGHO2_12_FULL_41_20]